MKLTKSDLKITAAQTAFLKRCVEFSDLENEFLVGMEVKMSIATALIRKGLARHTEGSFIALSEKGRETAKEIAAKKAVYSQ